MTFPAPGIYRDIPDQVYHAERSAMTKSRLAQMGKSPAHFQHRETMKQKADTDAMRFGRVFHKFVLEGLQEYVIWDGGRRSGKLWDAFVIESDGREILTSAEHDKLLSMFDAVHSNETAAEIIDFSRKEVTAVAELDGVLCKARADCLGMSGRFQNALADLKSTRDASPDGFRREIERYWYDVQAAFYSDVFAQAGQPVTGFLFIAVEVEPPYVCEVYDVSESLLDSGLRHYARFLEMLKQCRHSGKWPSYTGGGIHTLDAPPYGRMAMPHDLTLNGEVVNL